MAPRDLLSFFGILTSVGATTQIIDSQVTTDAGDGAYNLGTVKFPDGVTISGNSTTSFGGGVYNGIAATFTMDGGTVSGNDTNNIGLGGGLYNGPTMRLDGGITVKNN